ncbi:MAG: GIY-YIG nuclease family protein [Chlorobi bacterium]|nr:GIY-YIG nuclease family protein [Chlorobiota bacterium]
MLTLSVSISSRPLTKALNFEGFFCLSLMFTVYILYSHSLDSFYRGQTNNILERIKRHNSGSEKFTKSGIPWKLIWIIGKHIKAVWLQFVIIFLMKPILLKA